MTIVRCPRCRDEVTVPAKAGGRALVRCPLCLEEYLLAEALASAPPPLVVIGGEVEQEAMQLPVESEEYRLAGSSFAASEESSAASAVAMPRPTPRSTLRPRRKEKSGALLLVNYVGGGLMGLALGLLVLWWFFRRDPLGAGPAIAAYVPWVVPLEFRGRVADRANDERDAATELPVNDVPRSKKRRPQVAKSEEPKSGQRSEELQTLPTLDEPVTQPLAPKIDAPLLNEIEPPPDALGKKGLLEPDRIDLTNHARVAAPIQDGDVPARGPMPDLTPLLPDDWPAAVPLAERRAALVSAAEVSEAVTRAADAFKRLTELPANAADARAEALAELHGAAGEVGRLVSYRAPDDTELSDSIRRFEEQLKQAASQQLTLTGLEALAADRWADLPDGYGLLAVGTLKSQIAAGSFYEVTLEARGLERTVEIQVASTTDAQAVSEIGGRLLVAGRMVENPKVNLPGYEGEQPKVLAAGLITPAP